MVLFRKKHTSFSHLIGSLTGVTSCLEQISTEDTELSSTQVFVNVLTNETIGNLKYEYLGLNSYFP